MSTDLELPSLSPLAALRAQGRCPTCGAQLIPAGKRSWICPNQKDQGNGISPEMQAKVRRWLRERVPGCSF